MNGSLRRYGPAVALIPCTHLNHVNIVVEDFDASVQTFEQLLGASFVSDIPQQEWHAGLITISDAIFELFSPYQWLTNAKYGPHYVGAEYTIPDVAEARSILLERGIRLVRDVQVAVHTHPADTFGIAMELYAGNFHTRSPEWFKPVEYWRDEHPLGLTGLTRVSAAVTDADAAVKFFGELFGGVVEYEATRTGGAARAVGVRFGDSVLEFLTSTGPGSVAEFVSRYGDSVRATVFGVADLDRASAYFTERGVALRPGDDEASFFVDPEHTRGVLFEFAQP